MSTPTSVGQWCNGIRTIWRRLAAGVLLLLALVGLFSSLAAAAFFPDVPDSHPYAAAIADLGGRGIIQGYEDGRFGPADPVMRQQFAKMIVLTLELPVSEADVCPFPDVDASGPTSFYPDNYVAVAAKKAITLGTGPGTFAPYANISRAQVITMVVRAAQSFYPGVLAPPPASYASTWGDFSPDHADQARLAEYNGLLSGLPLSSLDPWGDMPRGEVAQVLHNLLGTVQPVSTTTATTATTTTATTTTSSTTTTTSATTTTTSSSTTTTTSPVNHPPIAQAGPDQSVGSGALVNLDGSASSDPDGDTLTYQWTQTVGSPVGLANATSAHPSFQAPTGPVTLTFSLVVNDGQTASPADTVTMTVKAPPPSNHAPKAEAGPAKTVASGEVSSLDGSASSDPDGDALTYQWTQTSGPTVTLIGATNSQPKFTAPTGPAALTFSLVVNDGQLSSSADTVTVTVKAPVLPHYESLGGHLAYFPGAVSWAPNHLDVFSAGDDGQLWHRYFLGGWSSWQSLGGAAVTTPSAVSWGQGRIDVYAGDGGGSCNHWWYDGAWHPYESLYGNLVGNPDAVVRGVGDIDIAVWQDTILYPELISVWDFHQGARQWGWNLGTNFMSSPKMVSWGSDHLDVFVRGPSGDLVHCWWSGGGADDWSNWESLGGHIREEPSVVSWAYGRIDAFARGEDNTLQHWWYDGGAWHGPESLGGELTGAPVAVSWGPNRLDILARGVDSGLWHKYYSGQSGWSSWQSLGGWFYGSPSVVSWGVGRLDVFAQGLTGDLLHWWYDGRW